MREGNTERGFTLIELMVVVAIVAILAVVVVPQFMSSTTKAKRKSEVSAMFNEIAAKQEYIKTEKGYYLGDISVTNYVGFSTCPSTVPTADYNFATTCSTTGSSWLAMRVIAPQSSIRCQYTMTTNVAGTNFTVPTGFKSSQGTLNGTEPAIATGWYHLKAVCDERGNGGTNATYFMSSIDRKLQAINEGN